MAEVVAREIVAKGEIQAKHLEVEVIFAKKKICDDLVKVYVMYNDDTDCLSSVFLFIFFSILSADWLLAVIMKKMQKNKRNHFRMSDKTVERHFKGKLQLPGKMLLLL